MHAVADFCLIPMGLSESSVSKYIAECQRVLEKTGLKYQLGSYGTGVEGEFDQVCKAIELCHEAVHKMGCPRVATDIRIGTRIDKKGSMEDKVNSVKAILEGEKAQQQQQQQNGKSSNESALSPDSIEMPEHRTLQRRISETQHFLASPMFEAPGRDF